jgi:hypothetical protein
MPDWLSFDELGIKFNWKWKILEKDYILRAYPKKNY